MSLGTDLAAAVASISVDSALLRAIVQGPASGGTSIVTLPNSAQVKTLARVASEAAGPHVLKAGDTMTGALNISGAAATSRSLLFQTAGVTRWRMRATITAEAGANAGSNFQIERYDDAGVTLGSAFLIDRATGAIDIGSTGSLHSLRLVRPKTGATTIYGFYEASDVKSDVTAESVSFQSRASTEAAAFTLSAYKHFGTAQGTIGAGSAITSQYGFHADSSLIGATNNYGVFLNIAAAIGRWSIYTGGALSYFGGGVGIKTTAIDAALDVAGDIAIIDGMTAPSATSGKAKIYVDSADGDLKVKFGDGTTKTIVVDT